MVTLIKIYIMTVYGVNAYAWIKFSFLVDELNGSIMRYKKNYRSGSILASNVYNDTGLKIRAQVSPDIVH